MEDHPLSKELFGDLPEDEYEILKQDIDDRGIQDALHVVKRGEKYIVVSGHQRKKIAIDIGIETQKKLEVPCIVRDDLKEDWQIEEQLIKDNLLRRNLFDYQRYKIGKHLEPIEKRKADIRKKATLKKGDKKPDVENLPPREDKGKTRDKVAKKLDVSGKQYDKIKYIGDKLDEYTDDAIVKGWKENKKSTHTTYNRVEKLEKNKQVAGKKVNKPLPKGKYSIILADPPWESDFSPTTDKRTQKHYPTMKLKEIKELEVPSADNAMLFLWTTAPMLKKALDVMKAWGFSYRTNAIWDKELMGTGFYFRGQHELLLLGRKGKLELPKPENRPRSVIREKRKKHSEKPKIIYKIIEQMYPNQKYLQLFARDEPAGWTSWGNEP